MNYNLFKFSKPKNVKKKRESVEDKTYKAVYERDERNLSSMRKRKKLTLTPRNIQKWR